MKERLRISSNKLLIPFGVSRDAYAQQKRGDDMTRTYIETANYLVKPYATDNNTAKATSDTAQLVKWGSEPAVRFGDAVRFKAARCGSAYPDERIEEMFIDGLPLTIRSGVRMFCGRELEAHLVVSVQYADDLHNQQCGHLGQFRIALRRFCEKSGRVVEGLWKLSRDQKYRL